MIEDSDSAIGAAVSNVTETSFGNFNGTIILLFLSFFISFICLLVNKKLKKNGEKK